MKNLKNMVLKYDRRAPHKGKNPSIEWKVEWRGDRTLKHALGQNHQLTDMLLRNRMNQDGIDLEIVPEPKNGIAIIRTPQVLPTAEQFEEIDMLARQVKEVW